MLRRSFSLLSVLFFTMLVSSGAFAATVSGSLTSSSANTTPVNLTTDQGTPSDWVHYGLTSATGVVRKANVVPQISSLIVVPTGTAAQTTVALNTYSWTDGVAPSTTATNTRNAVNFATTTIGSGFQIQVPADTTPKTLKVYVAAISARGRLEATLAGATPYNNTSVIAAQSEVDATYTINFTADGPNQLLTVRWLLEESSAANSALGFHAATLTGAAPAPFVWAGATGADWNVATNWTVNGAPAATFPQLQNDVAIFNAPAAALTVNVPTAVSVGTLQFENASQTITFNGAGPLRFDSSSGLAGLNVVTGGSTITFGTVPVELVSNTIIRRPNGITQFNSTVSGPTSSLTIGEAGTKLGGQVTLVSAGTMSSVTLNIGTLQAQAVNAMGAGTLTINGGTLQLRNNAAVTYDNSVVINGDTIISVDRVSANSSLLTLGSSTKTFTINNSPVITVQGGNGCTFRVDAPVTMNSSVTWNPTSAQTFVNREVSGGPASSLIVSGSGGNIFNLNVNNTYTGPTLVTPTGWLKVSGPTATSNSSGVTVLAQGRYEANVAGINLGNVVIQPSAFLRITVDPTATGTVPSASIQGIVELNLGTMGTGFSGLKLGAGSILRPVTGNTYGAPITLTGNATIENTNASLTVNGAISGAGNTLTVMSNVPTLNTCTFSGINTYGPGTTVAPNGWLRISNANQVNGTGVVVQSGGRIETNGTNVNFGGVTVNAGGMVRFSHTQDGTAVHPQPIPAVGIFEINNAAIGTAYPLQMGNGSTIRPLIAGTFASTVALSGTVNFDYSALSAPFIFSNAISESAAANLVKSGGGIVTLAAANTYSGTTTVNEGVLRLNGNLGSINTSSSLVVNSGATFEIDNTAGVGPTSRIGDSATVRLSGGRFAMSAAAANARTETIGVLEINSGESTLELTPNGANLATLTASDATQVNSGTVTFFRTGTGAAAQSRLFLASTPADGTPFTFFTVREVSPVAIGLGQYSTLNGIVANPVTPPGIVYTTVNSGNWDDLAIWTPTPPAGGPTAADEAIIGATHTVSLNGQDRSIRKLTLAATAVGGTNGISAGNTLNVISGVVTQNPPDTSVAGTGLRGDYYNNITHAGTAVSRLDPTINFTNIRNPPAVPSLPPGIGTDATGGSTAYSAIWTGFIKPSFSETYTISMESDDGIRVFVNNKMVIDAFFGQGGQYKWSSAVPMTANVPVAIRIEYYQGTGGNKAILFWSSPSQALGVIPATALYPSAAGGVLACGLNFSNVAGQIQNNGAGSLQIDSLPASNSAGMEFSGNGVSVLPNANAYLGGTTLRSGQLAFGNAASLSAGTLTVKDGVLSQRAATFNNAITLDGDLTLGTVPGNQVTTYSGAWLLTGNRAVTTNFTSNALQATLAGVISDGGNGYSFTKRGIGVIQFNAQNTWGGATYIYPSPGGSGLRLGVNNGLPVTTTLYQSAYFFNPNTTGVGTQTIVSTFDLGNFEQTLAAVAIGDLGPAPKLIPPTAVRVDFGAVPASNIVRNSGGTARVLTLTGTMPSPYFGIFQDGNLHLNKQTPGVLELRGSSAFGTVTISNGTLRGGIQGAIPNANFVLLPGTTLDSNGFNFNANSIVMTGATIQTGTGLMTLNGNFTAVSSGATSSVISGNMLLNASRTLLVNAGGADSDVDIQSVISGLPNLILTKTGLGILKLSGANTYVGPTVVSAGTLRLDGNSGSIANSASLFMGTGTTLDIDNAAGAGVNRIGDNAVVTLTNANLRMTAPNNTDRTETVGQLSVTGALSTIQLEGAGTGRSQLTVNGSGIGRSGQAQVDLQSSNPALANLYYSAGVDGSSQSFVTVNQLGSVYDGTGTSGQGVIALTANQYVYSVQAGDWNTGANWSGGVAPTAADHVIVQHTMTLNSAGPFNARTLTFLRASTDNPPNAYTISGAGTLNVAEGFVRTTDVGFAVPSVLTPVVISSGLNAGSELLTVQHSSTALMTISGVIAGSNGLRKSGAGELVLSNTANTFSGLVQLDAGVLNVPVDATLGVVDNNVIVSNATFRWTGTTTSARRFALNTAILDVAAGQTATHSTGLFGGTSLVKNGTGTLILNGGAVNALTATTVNAGVLGIGNNNSVQGSAITMNNATVLNIRNVTIAFASLTLNDGSEIRYSNGGGTVPAPGVTIANNARVTFNTLETAITTSSGMNAVNGGGGTSRIFVTGQGARISLQAAGNYVGSWLIGDASTNIQTSINFDNGASFGNSANPIELFQGRFGHVGTAGTMNNTVTVTGTNTLIYPIGGNRLIGFGGVIQANVTTTFSAIDYPTAGSPGRNMVFAGALQGSADVNVIGNTTAAAVTFSNPGTYTGTLTIGPLGVLAVTNTTGSATGTGVVRVDSGGTLGGTGTVGTVLNNQGGTLSPNLTSVGTLTTGNLASTNTSLYQFDVGTATDLIQVNGDLVLDGVLNVTAGAGFGAGSFTLMNYTGALTDNGMMVGFLPPGFNGTVTATAGVVTLNVTATTISEYSGGATVAAPVTGDWNVAGNWVPSGVPVGGPTTELRFGNPGTTAYTATNNIPGTLVVNRLSFGTNIGTPAIGGTGNPILQMAGTNPMLAFANTAQFNLNNTFTLDLTGQTLIQGTANQNIFLGNSPTVRLPVTGTGGLIVNTPGTAATGISTAAFIDGTYSGGFTLLAGKVVIGSPTFAGTGTLTLSGGTIRTTTTTPPALPVINNPVVLNGNVTFGDTSATNITFLGPVDLSGANRIINTNVPANTALILGGVVSNGGVVKTGTGIMQFNGGGANTYAGPTQVFGGSLVLNKGAAATNGAIISTLEIGDGLGGVASDIVQLATTATTQQIADTTTVVIDGGSGRFDLNSKTETVATISDSTRPGVAGQLNLGTNGVLNLAGNSSTIFSGVISGTTATLNKNGSGVLQLRNANTYTGTTNVNAGTLLVVGAQASNYNVAAAGSLTGTGSVNALTLNGTVRPGENGVGTLAIGAGGSTFNTGSTLAIDANGTTGVNGVLQVNGAINISNVTLAANMTGTSVAKQVFTLINNISTQPTTGTFVGLPNGATVVLGARSFAVRYDQGTDGNDVVLIDNSPVAYTADATNTTQSLDEGSGLLALTLDNADADALTFSIVSGALPAGITLNTNTGAFSGTAAFNAAGNYTVGIRVTDGATLALTTLAITVRDLSISVAANTPSVAEGTASVVFTVSRTGNADRALDVVFTTTDGTATSTNDYTTNSGTLSWAAGDTASKPVTVLLSNDTVFESTETFTLDLSSATIDPLGTPLAATVAINTASATQTITDNETMPTLTVANVSVTEGNAGTVNAVFTLELSGTADTAVNLTYATANGTALLANNDYQSATGSASIPALSLNTQVTVVVNGDTVYEADETFFLNLTAVSSNFTLGTPQSTATITNDETPPTISINDVTVTETNTGTQLANFVITQSFVTGADSTFTLSTANGTAVAGQDYVAVNNTFTIPAGQTQVTVPVTINNDTIFEPIEQFVVNLSGVVNATFADAQGVGTINTDDTVPPTISVNDVLGDENVIAGTGAQFVVSLNYASFQDVTFTFITSDDTAQTGDNDYTGVNQTNVTILAGNLSTTVTVPVTADTKFELNERFTVALSSVVNATTGDVNGEANLNNDDTAPTVSIANVTLAEGNAGTTAFNFVVSLSAASYQTVTVEYSTQDGTATVANNDYLPLTGIVLTFNPGQTSQNATVAVNGDTTAELSDTFTVTLANATNATIATGTATGTITNDDIGIVASTNAITTTESGGSAVVSIALGSIPATPVTLNLVGNTAEGTLSVNTLTFAANATALVPQNVTVTGVDDLQADGNVTYNLQITVAAGSDAVYLAQTPPTVTVTNNDNDTAGATVTPTTLTTSEGGAVQSFTVVLTSQPTQNVTINLANGNTAEGTLSTTALTFTPANYNVAQTVTVTPVTDSATDGNVVYTIATTAVSADAAYNGVAISDVTVTNNDNAAPVVSSGLTATPNPATVGAAVAFSVAASDPTGQPLSVTYDYGDGTSGTAATHVYTIPQIVTVTALISDGVNTVTSSVTLTVLSGASPDGDGDSDGIPNSLDSDDDGDGFSDEIEVAAGTSPTSSGSSPGLNNAAAGIPGGLNGVKLAISLNFSKTNSDSVKLSGTLDIPAGLVVANQLVVVDIGGTAKAFTLNAKGQSPKGNDTFKLSVKASKGVVPTQIAKYSASFKKGSFAAALADEGLTNATVSKQTRTVKVSIVFNQKLLVKDQAQSYSAKAGKTGKTK